MAPSSAQCRRRGSLIVAAVNQASCVDAQAKLDFRSWTLARAQVNAEIALADRKIMPTSRSRRRNSPSIRQWFHGAVASTLPNKCWLPHMRHATRLNWARTRVIFSGEGRTRLVTNRRVDKIREARDSGLHPIERLNRARQKHSAALQTVQDAVAAHSGRRWCQPIIENSQRHIAAYEWSIT